VQTPTPIRGQALALFAIFLVVLMGAAAVAIDYANWLLTDRQLQNVADHAAHAGAAQFSCDFSASSCASGGGPAQCLNSRTQAWASLNQDLNLGLTDATISTLASTNSPAVGQTSVTQGGGTLSFNHRIWVSTPPPDTSGGHNEYHQVGGLYADSFGIMFVRVDRPTRTYLGGVFGINVRDRIGWATAGILPTDFALSVFCRNNIAPEPGVCADGGTSLGIDGGGGITLVRGDIGSSNSLQVTQQTGQGVIVEAGNVFVVNGTCGPSSWNCPPATLGGISDGSGTAKNAFYTPPIPVPQYALPSGAGTLPWADTGSPNTTCGPSAPCIPGTGAGNTTPMDWACGSAWDSSYTNSFINCGTPVVTTTNGTSTIQCTGNGTVTQDLYPKQDTTITPNSSWSSGGPGQINGGGNIYKNIDEVTTAPNYYVDPTGTSLPPPPPSTQLTFPSSPVPNNYASSADGVGSAVVPATYRVALSSPNGTLQTPGYLYARYVMFKTVNGTYDSTNGGNQVQVRVSVQDNAGGSWATLGSATGWTDATGTITAYQTPQIDQQAIISAGDPTGTHLSLLFEVQTTKSTGSSQGQNRGAGISWAEGYLDTLPVPPPPPLVSPGLYRSILIPDNGCAILDPTGQNSGGILQYQMPGIYYFKDANGGSKNAQISLGNNSFLIGDGVTLVFDSNWPDPSGTGGSAGAHGIQIGTSGALIMNSAITGGYNPSCGANPAPCALQSLPFDALSAAWEVDPTNTGNGVSAWGGACPNAAPCSVPRSSYAGQIGADRGITFYFKPKTNGFTDQTKFSILGRFQMGGNVAGLSFRGILYAPYDNVEMSGANGFDTVGMVLAWTAKFNGGSASIKLDYPFTRLPAAPYLLEPSIQQ
jgi:hypothetical protein